MFADGFSGILETKGGVQKPTELALGYTRKQRVTANVNKIVVLVCNEDKKSPVGLKRKWGDEELSIADQYIHLGVRIPRYCSSDAYMSKVMEKGYLHLDTQGERNPQRFAPEYWDQEIFRDE